MLKRFALHPQAPQTLAQELNALLESHTEIYNKMEPSLEKALYLTSNAEFQLAAKLLGDLAGKEAIYSDADFAAATNGKLDEILRGHEAKLPEQFVAQRNQHLDQLSDQQP